MTPTLLAHECRRTPGSWARACHLERGLLPLWACWWQDERDDPRRADAVRWLAAAGKWPLDVRDPGSRDCRRPWEWDADDGGWDDTTPAHCLLPQALHEALGANAAGWFRVNYRTPEAAVLDLLRAWRPELVEG